MPPARVLPEPDDGGKDITKFAVAGYDGLAVVGKGQGDTPFARDGAAYLHDGDKRLGHARIKKGEIDRPVAVGLVQDPCPVRGVEERATAGGGDKVVPGRTGQRVYYL